MKIEKISYNKIKVSVSIDDLSEWGVSFESFAANSPETQDLFWDLIQRAENETGFVVNNSQIIIEAIPSKNDGLILYVTRLDEEDDRFADSLERLARSANRRTRYKVKKPNNPDLCSSRIFVFDSFDDLCEFISIGYIHGQNSLYMFENVYYLLLGSDVSVDLNIIGEYAQSAELSRFSEAFLNEYAQPIILEDAYAVLKSHF